ncbi:MAG TPA: acyl-CoA desaturase [Bacteroidia bacterium]|nr:acyl-CoA desaturase [Bacteroidia bacterium]
MKLQKPQFSKEDKADFPDILKQRVNEYFRTTNKSRHANLSMKLKSALMLTLFIAPLVLMLAGVITQPWLMFIMWGVMGLGMAGIGTGIMHDALHGVYSKKQRVNKLLGLTMNLIGANAAVWKIQHNTLHHSFTNIEHADDDIVPPFVLRFSPNQKRYWIHRFQHIYAWLLYGVSSLFLVTTKTITQLIRFYKTGMVSSRKEFGKKMLHLGAWKLFYFGYILVLPMLLLPVSPIMVILMFITMHLVTGTLLSAIFQPAHVVPDSVFPDMNKEKKQPWNWTVHQFLTTSNYAPRGKVFSWLIGGLNYQVEHHLFPNICHIHYGNIAGIVQKTAQEFNVPYHSSRTFFSALRNHTRLLKQLGRGDRVPA